MNQHARRRASFGLVAGVVLLSGAALAAPSTAATNAQSSVVVPSSPGKAVPATWTATAPFNNGQAGLVYGQLGLDDPTNACSASNKTLNSQHTVQVSFPKGLNPAYDTLVRFQINWKPAVNEPAEDLALVVYGPDGKLVSSSDGSQASEGVNVTDRVSGVYNVLVCAFQNPPQGTVYHGSATAFTVKSGSFPRALHVVSPTYRQYTAPATEAKNAGEPSIGNNWKSGATLFTADTAEYVVAFHDQAGTSTWTKVNTDTADPSNKISLDPIGYTDSTTGRTFVSQLVIVCSGAAYSDDDFTTAAKVSQGCGSGINGGDHQTFGGGPFPEGLTRLPTSNYPHAVYYCAQGQAFLLGSATCARSDDGGLSFGAPVNTWTDECSGIHGHVKVSPADGTVYLPDGKCGDQQGVAVSRDGGAHWVVRHVPDSLAGESDPSVDVGSDGTVYLGYSDGTGHPRVAISRNHGQSWTRSIDLGVPFGVRNSEFAEVVAGDGDRAAVAYLGTRTPGSTQASSFGKDSTGSTFTGAEWHLYVSTTYDRGAHWTTVDTTPRDPVQRGCIWNSGGSNPCRNLLDFNAITIDKTGRVMVGFADGCVSSETSPGNDCVADASVSANKLVNHGAIVRQLTGKTLFRAFDPKGAAPTVNPPVTPARTPSRAPASGHLPATGGAELLGAMGALLLLGGILILRRKPV